MNASPELDRIAARIRGKLVDMSHAAKTPHLGSSLSCVDMLVAAYFDVLRIDPTRPEDPGRDRFILSKGHAATAIYTTLAFRGFFDPAILETYNQDGGPLAEHPGPGCVPGIEAATGSLGHGLSIGLGMAVAGRIARRDYKVFALMSDGECNEGSVWEAALFAAANRLDRVCALIDYNKWQATGRSDEVLGLPSLAAKWSAFNWRTAEVDGHDIGAIVREMRRVPDGDGRPTAIICHTVKGKGVSFMEDDNNWHYRIPTADEVVAAHAELGLA
jgi:transketolase